MFLALSRIRKANTSEVCMHAPTRNQSQKVRTKERPPDWLPPREVKDFVTRLLSEPPFNIDIFQLDDRWIPLAIAGAFDWLNLTGWWWTEYSGIRRTNEPFEKSFILEGVYTFKPDKIWVFRDFPEESAFYERLTNPGLSLLERQEVIQFILRNVCEKYDVPAPPRILAEHIVWATFMWVLSPLGHEWFLEQDGLFACADSRAVDEEGLPAGYGVAYLGFWQTGGRVREVLEDPRLIESVDRDPNACTSCGVSLWCVQGYSIDGFWDPYCNYCAVDAADSGEVTFDGKDGRIQNPMCGSQTCMNTDCPYLDSVTCDKTGRRIPHALVRLGQKRLIDWEEQVAQIGGMTPRQLSGQTADDIVQHFR